MPLFALIGRDGEQGLALRKQHREAHLAGMEPLDAAGRIHHAGPLLDATRAPTGSLVVFEAADLAEAQAIAARDPYVTQGIFASYEVFETKVVFPRGKPG